MMRTKVVVALYPFRAIEGGDLSLEKVSETRLEFFRWKSQRDRYRAGWFAWNRIDLALETYKRNPVKSIAPLSVPRVFDAVLIASLGEPKSLSKWKFISRESRRWSISDWPSKPPRVPGKLIVYSKPDMMKSMVKKRRVLVNIFLTGVGCL